MKYLFFFISLILASLCFGEDLTEEERQAKIKKVEENQTFLQEIVTEYKTLNQIESNSDTLDIYFLDNGWEKKPPEVCLHLNLAFNGKAFAKSEGSYGYSKVVVTAEKNNKNSLINITVIRNEIENVEKVKGGGIYRHKTNIDCNNGYLRIFTMSNPTEITKPIDGGESITETRLMGIALEYTKK